MYLIVIIALLVSISLVSANFSPKLDNLNLQRSQNIGSVFKIFCAPQEGTKPFRFEWHKNGVHLPLTSSLYRIETSEDDSLFVIDKVSESDSGNYSCLAANNVGTDRQFTTLLVKGLCDFHLIH